MSAQTPTTETDAHIFAADSAVLGLKIATPGFAREMECQRDEARRERDDLRKTLEAVQSTHYALSMARAAAEAERDAIRARVHELEVARTTFDDCVEINQLKERAKELREALRNLAKTLFKFQVEPIQFGAVQNMIKFIDAALAKGDK